MWSMRLAKEAGLSFDMLVGYAHDVNIENKGLLPSIHIKETMSFTPPSTRYQRFDNEINFVRETASHWHHAFLREADTNRK
jgi:hypothetical protein